MKSPLLVLAAALVMTAPLLATAATSTTGATLTGGGATWTDIGNTGSGFGVGDAATGGQDDAFDNALTFQVNGTTYDTPGGTFDLDGQTATGAIANLAGLDVRTTFYADPSSPTLRTLFTLFNPTGGDIAVTVRMQTDVGSDGATRTIATSSGGLGFTTADRWIVTDDTPLGGTGGDPANTHVIAGPGAATLPSLVDLALYPSGTQGVRADYELVLGAGAIRSLLFFNQIHTTPDLAVASAGRFDSLSPGDALLAGLSDAELARVANFSFGAAVVGVPEPASTALAALAGVALLASRRRRAVDARA